MSICPSNLKFRRHVASDQMHDQRKFIELLVSYSQQAIPSCLGNRQPSLKKALYSMVVWATVAAPKLRKLIEGQFYGVRTRYWKRPRAHR